MVGQIILGGHSQLVSFLILQIFIYYHICHAIVYVIGCVNEFGNGYTLTMRLSMQLTISLFMALAESLTMILTGCLAAPFVYAIWICDG